MRINHKSYKNYIEKLSSNLAGKGVFSPVLLNNETFLFPLKENNHKSLVLSFNHASPLIYIIDDDRFYSSFENTFFLRMKKLFSDIQIRKICLNENDLIINISVIVNDEIEDKQINLIAELIPNKPNLILTNEKDEIIEAFYKDKNRNLNKGEKYNTPFQKGEPCDGEQINEKVITNHFNNEVLLRRKERYQAFLTFINGKIKQLNRKIKAIENDVQTAQENLKSEDEANEILCLGLNLKSHVEEVEISSRKIALDQSKTILENIEHFYKKAKKAKETILRSQDNIKNAQDEIQSYQELLNKFNNANETEADKLMLEIGMIKKKKEVKETVFNRPYKVNLNGTIIYFGRNASQNDYLSFVMKLDREFTWLHIKDKSGAHLVIANKKPTDKEIQMACEISLLCSRTSSGEVVYTKKKNVRRGHVLGEAILKNHSTAKINFVSNEAKELFSKAERLK